MNWEPQKPLRVSRESEIHHNLSFVCDLSLFSLSPIFLFFSSHSSSPFFYNTFLILSLHILPSITHTRKKERERFRAKKRKKSQTQSPHLPPPLDPLFPHPLSPLRRGRNESPNCGARTFQGPLILGLLLS